MRRQNAGRILSSKPTTGLEDGEFVAHHAVELLLKRVFLSNLCVVSFIKKNRLVYRHLLDVGLIYRVPRVLVIIAFEGNGRENIAIFEFPQRSIFTVVDFPFMKSYESFFQSIFDR